jgi:hypothetical protein
MNDHMVEVGLDTPSDFNPDSNTAGAVMSPVVTHETHQNMVVDSPTEAVNVDTTNLGVKETSGPNDISTPSRSNVPNGATAAAVPPSTGTNMGMEES